jgi:hypothetical protein
LVTAGTVCNPVLKTPDLTEAEARMDDIGPLPVASTDLTLDALAALMEKHNVSRACTLSTLGLLLDPAVGNAATRAACYEHDLLLPTATLNPTLFFGSTAPLKQLKDDGFYMVRFFPTEQRWPVGFAPFAAIVEGLAPVGLPIMVGVRSPGEITALEPILGGYPGPVILSDVGTTLLAESVAALRRQAHWHVEISSLLMLGAIKAVADSVGADRLLFGTGAPSRPVAGALRTLDYAGVSGRARKQILAGNARRILKIPNRRLATEETG